MRLLSLLLLTGAVVCARTPDLVLQGEISGRDHQSYLRVPFEVPAGVARLTISLAYSGREQRTTIDLGLLGPGEFADASGFRGWSGGNKSVVTVSAVDATPSYLPTPIEPGEWALLLGIPNIRANSLSRFTADVYFSPTLAVADEPEVLRPALSTEARWYRGDFHTHTAHSDGWVRPTPERRVPAPAFLVAEAASARPLDFVGVTEHNTPSSASALRELQPLFPTLLLIPGQELTTFHGHANALGTVERFDFRVGSPDVPTWNDLAAQVQRGGGLLSINHPVRPSGEACMGCGWTAAEVDYARFHMVEVVNGRDADTPYSGVPFWHELLNRGHRLIGIGGSDNHGWREPSNEEPTGTEVGQPSTVVWAEALSTPAVLEGVRTGRVFIDVAGCADRVLDFTATSGETTVHAGGELRPAPGTPVHYQVNVEGVAVARLVVWVNGQTVSPPDLQQRVDDTGLVAWEFTLAAGEQPGWLRVDVRDGEGRLALIGNPVFLRPALP